MHIDYVRVYQRSDMLNIGCDPEDYPTYDYIEKHKTAYMNRNMTIWEHYLNSPEGSKYRWPKNRLLDKC